MSVEKSSSLLLLSDQLPLASLLERNITGKDFCQRYLNLPTTDLSLSQLGRILSQIPTGVLVFDTSAEIYHKPIVASRQLSFVKQVSPQTKVIVLSPTLEYDDLVHFRRTIGVDHAFHSVLIMSRGITWLVDKIEEIIRGKQFMPL